MRLHPIFFITFSIIQLTFKLSAQAVDSIYKVEDLDIHTVQFANVFDGSGSTVISLKEGGTLTLHFDDLNTSLKNFNYTIEQYDRDWKPSRLEKAEYLQGYLEDKIITYQNAQATNIPFVHYQVSVPNENMRISKSGNYLLRVFLDDDNKTTIITRRFIVIEPLVTVSPLQSFPNALIYNTHHEVHFQIDYKNFKISNPNNEIRATVLQNDRWDNAKYTRAPQYIQGESIMYDYADTFAFNAGKEWRYLDLRSTRFRSERVQTLNKGEETWNYTLFADVDRSHQTYIYYPDISGKFFINTTDYNNSTLPQEIIADYVNVNFFLAKKEKIEDTEVYLFGAFSDWKIDDRFKLEFNEQKKIYTKSVLLKQGFYNYFYATTHGTDKAYDISTLEGDWYGAQNDYTVIVYFRPFGARYDRIIGYLKYKIQAQ